MIEQDPTTDNAMPVGYVSLVTSTFSRVRAGNNHGLDLSSGAQGPGGVHWLCVGGALQQQAQLVVLHNRLPES